MEKCIAPKDIWFCCTRENKKDAEQEYICFYKFLSHDNKKAKKVRIKRNVNVIKLIKLDINKMLAINTKEFKYILINTLLNMSL